MCVRSGSHLSNWDRPVLSSKGPCAIFGTARSWSGLQYGKEVLVYLGTTGQTQGFTSPKSAWSTRPASSWG